MLGPAPSAGRFEAGELDDGGAAANDDDELTRKEAHGLRDFVASSEPDPRP
jgi:hypothetical protein